MSQRNDGARIEKLLERINSSIPEKNFSLYRPRYFELKDDSAVVKSEAALHDPTLLTTKFSKLKQYLHMYTREDLVDLGVAEEVSRSMAAVSGRQEVFEEIGGQQVQPRINYRRVFMSAFTTPCFQYSTFVGIGAATVAASVAYFKTRTFLFGAKHEHNSQLFCRPQIESVGLVSIHRCPLVYCDMGSV